MTKETRAQVIERVLYNYNPHAIARNGEHEMIRLIRDFQARERVLVEALEEAYTDAVLGGLKQSGRQIQQTLARINSGDWMDV